MMLVAAAPILMVLVPWDFGSQYHAYRSIVKVYGLVIPILEFLLIFGYLIAGKSIFSLAQAVPLTVKLLFGLLAIWSVYSATLVAPYKFRAIISLPVFLLHSLFTLVVFEVVRNSTLNARRTFCSIVIVSLVIYCFIWALSLFWYPLRGDQWITNVPGVSNVRGVGFFAVFGFFASFMLWAHDRERSGLGVVIAYLGGLVAISLAFWTGSRGSVFAISAGCAVILGLSGKLKLPVLKFIVPVFLFAALISLALPLPNPAYGILRFGHAILDSGEDLSSGRLMLWQGTVEKILERPFAGWGLDQFKGLGPETFRGYNQPHNVLLQILFSLGFVGLLLISAITLDLLRRAKPSWECPDSVIATGAATAVIIFAQFDAALYYNYPIMMFAICIAAIFILSRPKPAPDRSG